jgi:hypothetical protein
MSPRTFYLAAAGLILCLSAYLFTQNFAFVRERVWVGLSGEARVNGLLAARMLLTRMGSRVLESSDLARLGQFAADGTVFLAADRKDMDPASATRLLDWVSDGGRLVVAAQRNLTRDPLMEALGVTVKDDELRKSDPKAEEVELPDGMRLRVEVLPSARLYDNDNAASWRHESQGAIRMLQIPYDDGFVTVLSTFRPFNNRAIGRLDHAELLWHLASDGGRPVEVWLVRHLDAPSLPQWLVKNALPCMVALGVFLALALWRAIPRFGPLQPNPTPDRRSLVEHLAAMGRFYSMQRQLPKLIRAVRQDGLELLGSRAPETRGQDGAARLKSAARLTGLRPRELLQAFTAPVTTPHEFILAVRVLAAFRQQLTPHGKPAEPRRPRGWLPSGGDRKDRRRDHKTRAEFARAFHETRAHAKDKT